MADRSWQTLRLEYRTNGVALLRLDVPERSLNVINRQLLEDLEQAVTELAAAKQRMLVIRSDKVSGFLAGADLTEFATIQTADEARAISARGQALFQRLADLPYPTLALIHGPCLGGGLELALACDYRLVLDHPKTQIGLPEVELGLLPGWGGTQRLPRLVGIERALRIILGGKRLTAQEAFKWGLADGLGASESELAARLSLFIERAPDLAKQAQRQPRRTWRQRLMESTPLGRLLIVRGAERRLRQRVPDDMPAPWEALAAVQRGFAEGRAAGFAYEQEAAGRLATSTACRHLLQLFLQTEAARKAPPATDASPPIRKIAVIGAGVMGAGIAQLAAIRGNEVIVREVDDRALAAGKARIEELFEKAVKNRVLSATTAREKQAQIRFTSTAEGIAEVELAIEAVIEDLAIKEKVFQELERRCRPGTILATNTSSLLVSQMQEGLSHPERVAGLHFFNPVHKMPLVEVVRTPRTDQRTIDALVRWAIGLGKTPVVVKDSPGFIVNRILMPYLYEAFALAVEGLSFPMIDGGMRRFGMPMGPLELLDQIGLDVAAHVLRSAGPAFQARFADPPGLSGLQQTLEALTKRGWLGQKTGRGFYLYRGRKRRPHAAARALLPRPAGAAAGMLQSLPKAAQQRECQERLVLCMVNEAAFGLEEGLAAGMEAIDLAMVLGSGWAPHRGGPLHYGADRGWASVVEKLDELAKRVGGRFEPSVGLRKWAQQGLVHHGP